MTVGSAAWFINSLRWQSALRCYTRTRSTTTSPLNAATRTTIRPVVFRDGFLGVEFAALRVYRPGVLFAFNISLFTLPVDIDALGVPVQEPLLQLQSSRFSTLLAGQPASMRFEQPAPVYMTEETWTVVPSVIIVDVYGGLL